MSSSDVVQNDKANGQKVENQDGLARLPYTDLPLEQENKPELQPQPVSIVVSSNKVRPTWVEVFTGQAMDVIARLDEANALNDELLQELKKARLEADKLSKSPELSDDAKASQQLLAGVLGQRIESAKVISASLEASRLAYRLTPGKLWLYQWSLVFLLFTCGLAEAFFIELYCRWHGSYFISLDLFNPVNVQILSQITFVNGPTTLSIAGEVLMWSSLGVWAQQSYNNAVLMLRRKFRYADHGPLYIGIMMRNTSIASAIVIFLRLSNLSIFGVSLSPTNPQAFDTTVGIAFLLGFFGDDAYRILSGFRNRLVKGTEKE